MERCFALRLICVLLLVSGLAHTVSFSHSGSTPELITDRPDQTESSAVIPAGFAQVESGWTVRSEEGRRLHEWPSTLVRIGLGIRTELRLSWDGMVCISDRSIQGDTGVGAKVFLWEQSRWLPEAAILVDLALPTGSAELSSYRSDPGIRLTFSNAISERVSVGYNAGFVLSSEKETSEDIDTGNAFVYTAALGISLTDRLSGFMEVFGGAPLSLARSSGTAVDGGLTYLILPNVQLDFSAGRGLTEKADDWFLGAGFSFRIPR